MLKQDVQQLARKRELVASEAHLLQFEHRVRQKDVVVQIRVQMRAAILVGGQQAAVAPQTAADEIERPARGLGEILSGQDPGSNRHSADHQAVP